MSKNENHLANIIIGQSRHQFVYGYNGKAREELLKRIVGRFPIMLDKSTPIGIYLDNIGLPKIEHTNDDLDKITLSAFAREYCNFSITISVLNETLKQIDESRLVNRGIELLNEMNQLTINERYCAKTLQELTRLLKISRNIYSEKYVEYVKTGKMNNPINEAPISFISLRSFIRYYKQMINTNSYIAVIVDHQFPIALKSHQAINSLVNARINADLSVKVACEPNGWDSFVDLNGDFIEATHDYGTTELDESNDEYTKKLKLRYNCE